MGEEKEGHVVQLKRLVQEAQEGRAEDPLAKGAEAAKEAEKPKEPAKDMLAWARKFGMQAFLMKLTDRGDVTKLDQNRALVALAQSSDEVRGLLENHAQNVKAVLHALREQLVSMFARQEVLAENHKRLYFAVHQYDEAMREYNAARAAYGWWKRRKLVLPRFVMPQLLDMPELLDPNASVAEAEAKGEPPPTKKLVTVAPKSPSGKVHLAPSTATEKTTL
jgi:hypothetical protein